MGSESQPKIPVIDFSKQNLKPGTSTWLATRDEVRRALEEFGCFDAIYTAVPSELRDQVFSVAEELFDLPLEVKLQNKSKTPFCGYYGHEAIPLYESLAIHEPTTLEGTESFTKLLWPDGNDRFSTSTRDFSEIVAGLCETIMRMIIESYGLERECLYMMEAMKYLFRYIKYRKPEREETKVGLTPHTDKDLFTLIHQDRIGGLQVQTKDGEWVDVEPSPSSFLVLAGDILMAWSNDRIHACCHRVIMGEEEGRYSLGMFILMSGTLHIPKSLVDEMHPSKYTSFQHFGFLDFYQTEEGISSACPIKAYCEYSVKTCMAKAVDKATAGGYNVDSGLKAVGLTNQRETTVVWSKSTGCPLYNAIVWMDARTSSICRKLEKELPGGKAHFVESCGLPISTYFSALKLLWLMENVDAVKVAISKGDALFGTVDTWLIWNLTGGKNNGLHVTDVSNASRTMLMNLKTLDWDKATLKTLGIPAEILPKIVSNSEVIGKISSGWPITGVPISGCLGDQHAAMLGQACSKGEAKSTYGTGAFILLNTGEGIVKSNHGLLSTLAFKLGPAAPTNYALEGSIAIAGAAVQWLRDNLGLIASANEIEHLASQVESTGGVYFVPAFNGLFAPWWRDDARGVCIGITRYTNRAHIARAVLESMCFQVKDVLDSMHKDAGEKGEVKNEKGEFLLRVDGGATVNNLLMQTQANLLGSPVVRPADIETTALGAAYAAGLAVGVWTEKEIFAHGERDTSSTTFHPMLDEKLRKKKVESWCKAVERTFGLADLSL